MTDYTHDTIRAMLDSRTPGEWKHSTDTLPGGVKTHTVNIPVRGGNKWHDMRKADAELIANAPDIIAQLLGEVEAAQAENERLRRGLRSIRSHGLQVPTDGTPYHNRCAETAIFYAGMAWRILGNKEDVSHDVPDSQ